MDTFLLDLKYGMRSLWRDKGFALTVLLTFSVCIAANTALFAIVNSVILRPLPVSDANSILITSNEYPKAGVTGTNNSSSGDYFDRLREMTVFDSQAVFRQRDQTVELNGSPQQIHGMLVTPSWFEFCVFLPPSAALSREKKAKSAPIKRLSSAMDFGGSCTPETNPPLAGNCASAAGPSKSSA